MRLHLRGELHDDYQENFGLKAADGVCCNFLRVHHRDLIERVEQGGTDEEILQWCFEKGRRLNAGDLFVWNGICIEARLARFDHAASRRTKKTNGNADHDDIHSRPHRFRRGPILGSEQDFVSSSNFAWLRVVGVAIGLCSLVFSSCNYDVPITSAPTRKVQERLLGDWTSDDGKEKLKLRNLDDSVYVVYYDGDLFRAYHSDVAATPLVSVQDLNSRDRKFAYVVWKLSDDGKNLRLRSVNDKVVPKETKDSADVMALLTKNARNPELFGEEIEFKKEK